MNTRKDTTSPAPSATGGAPVQAAAEGLPTMVQIAVNVEALKPLSLHELRNLWDGVQTLLDVCAGLCCQPKYFSAKQSLFNPAGDQLDYIQELLANCEDEILHEASERVVDDAKEVEHRAWLLLHSGAKRCDDVHLFATTAVREGRHCQLAEKRRAAR